MFSDWIKIFLQCNWNKFFETLLIFNKFTDLHINYYYITKFTTN